MCVVREESGFHETHVIARLTAGMLEYVKHVLMRAAEG